MKAVDYLELAVENAFRAYELHCRQDCLECTELAPECPTGELLYGCYADLAEALSALHPKRGLEWAGDAYE